MQPPSEEPLGQLGHMGTRADSGWGRKFCPHQQLTEAMRGPRTACRDRVKYKKILEQKPTEHSRQE